MIQKVNRKPDIIDRIILEGTYDIPFKILEGIQFKLSLSFYFFCDAIKQNYFRVMKYFLIHIIRA